MSGQYDDPGLRLNPEPVCPHCRAKQTDAWELQLEEDEVGETECEECDKTMNITAHYNVTYSTWKVSEKGGKDGREGEGSFVGLLQEKRLGD